MSSPRIPNKPQDKFTNAPYGNKKNKYPIDEINAYYVNLNDYLEKVGKAANDSSIDLLKTLLCDEFYAKPNRDIIGYDVKRAVWIQIAVGLAANNCLAQLISLQMPLEYRYDIFRDYVSHALAKKNQQNISAMLSEFIKPGNRVGLSRRLVEGYLEGKHFESAISLILTITTENEFNEARSCFVTYFINKGLGPNKLFAFSRLATDDGKAERFNLLTLAFLEKYVSAAMLHRREKSVENLFKTEDFKKYRKFIFNIVINLVFHAESVYVQLWEDIDTKMKFIVELVSEADDLSEFKEFSNLLIDAYKNAKANKLEDLKQMCRWEIILHPEDGNAREREKERFYSTRDKIDSYRQACEELASFSETNSLDKIYSWLCKAIVKHQMNFIQRFIISLHVSENCFNSNFFADSEKSFSTLKNIPNIEARTYFYMMLCQFKPNQRENIRFFELNKNKLESSDHKQIHAPLARSTQLKLP
jgi:hypothetical protein